MKCFYHHDKDAHVICKNCNKAICTDCTVDIRGEMYCPDCFSNLIAYQEKYLSKLKMVYIVGGIIASVVFFSFVGKNFEGALLLAIWFGSAPIGLFASKNAPSPYVPVSMEGLGKLLLMKLGIALIFGPIFAIISIFNYLNTSKTVQENKALLEQIMSHQAR